MHPDRLNRTKITHIDDFVFVIDLEALLGDGGDLPLGVVVTVRLVHVDNVFSQLSHYFNIIRSTNSSSL
jgi:hypothetical protein